MNFDFHRGAPVDKDQRPIERIGGRAGEFLDLDIRVGGGPNFTFNIAYNNNRYDSGGVAEMKEDLYVVIHEMVERGDQRVSRCMDLVSR